MQLMKQMLASDTSRGSLGSQGAAFLFSHLPLLRAQRWLLPADALTRLMEHVGEGPGTSPGIIIHQTI